MSDAPAGHVSLPDGFDDAPLSSPLERRRHARKKLAQATAVLLDGSTGSSATIVDLSEGGVGVRSEAPLATSSTCRLQLSVGDSNQVVDAACELAWMHAPHAGFRFSILTEKCHRQIKSWLRALEVGSDPSAAQPQAVAEPLPLATSLGADPPHAVLASLSDDTLLSLALRARELAGADGAAVAVDDGTAVICRASVGSAPDVGVRIQSKTGLSGECLRSGEIVACYDTETDGRVDPLVARELNMRSAVILPIGRHDMPAGLLEVFFTRAHAFDEAQIYALQELCSEFLLASHCQAAPPPTEILQEENSLPKLASFTEREAAPGFVICDVCGHDNPERNRACERCDVPLPSALRYVDLNSPIELEGAGLRPERTQVEIPDPAERPGRGKKLLVMLVALVLLAAWQARGRISTDADLPMPPAAPKPVVAPALERPTAKREKILDVRPARAAEPEVTVRNFLPAKPRASKSSPAKPAAAKKVSLQSSTIPTEAMPQSVSGTTEPAALPQQSIVLPLNDQAVVAAVATPASLVSKQPQSGFWKRLGRKFVPGKVKPGDGKRQ